MIKGFFRAGVCAASVALAGCGGGGSSGGGGPQPTPPPPAAFPLTKTGSFNTISSMRTYHNDAGNTAFDTFGVSGGRNSSVTISYDASTKTYTVKSDFIGASFSSASLSFDGYIDTYTSPTTFPIYDRLKLYNNVRAGASQSGAPVKLSYLSYGVWEHTDFSNLDKYSKTYLLFGYPTGDSSMPKTGSATYKTAVTADHLAPAFPGAESAVGGSATFTANFGGASVSTDLTLNMLSTGASLGTYSGNGAISGDQFSGSFTNPDLSYGGFAGGFFGPSAAEMGYTFMIVPQTGPGQGAITGVVVGTKN